MSERDIDARRNWKAETFPYDYFTVDQGKECQYCLTEKQAEILRGIIQPLNWHTRWWSDTDTPINRDVIEAFTSDLTRRLMMSCCGDEGTLFRYNDDGVYQQSTDGGATWEDVPDYTETSIVWQDPNTMGISTSKCQAADGVVQTFKVQVTEQIADDMGYAAIAGVIVAVLLIFLSAGTTGAITAQIAGLVGLIFGAGVAAWKAAMTDDVWNEFRCMVYCHMNSGTSISAAGLDALKSDIDAHITGIAAPTLHGYVKAAGVVGLTNMMRSGIGSSSANCDDCNCDPCSPNAWTEGLGNIIEIGDDYFILESVETTPGEGGRTHRAWAYTGDTDDCCCMSIEMVTPDGGGGWQKYMECSAGFEPENYIHGLPALNQPVPIVGRDDTAPFQMKVTLIGC